MQVLTLCTSVRLTYRNSMIVIVSNKIDISATFALSTPLVLPVRIFFSVCTLLKFFANVCITRGQSNLTKSASRGAHSPVRGHPRGSKFVPLNSWGRVSY